MKKYLLLIMFLSACSTGYSPYGTHPAHQNIADFIFGEIGTVVKTGRVDPDFNNRAKNSAFNITQSEYWRLRQEREIEERERERLERLERERYYYRNW
jgi:hypothetical protein